MAVAYTRSTGVAPSTNMKNVWFGALGRGIYQGGIGWGGEECGGASAVQAVRPAGDGPPKALRDIILSDVVVVVCSHSLLLFVCTVLLFV